MVNPIYTATDKRLPKELKRIKASLLDVQRPAGTQKEQTLLRMQEMIADIAVAQQDLEEAFEAQAEIQAEQQARASITQALANLVVTANPPASTPGSANWASSDRVFTPPSPAMGARYVDVNVSGSISGTNTGSSMPVAHLMLLRGTTPLMTDVVQVPAASAAGYPPSWGTKFRIDSSKLLLPSGSAALTLRLYVGAYYMGGSTTITLSDMSATTDYGQRG